VTGRQGVHAGAAAVRHRAGGERAGASSARGTYSSTGNGGWEPSMGVTPKGTLFFNTQSSGLSDIRRSRDQGATWETVDINIPGAPADQPTVDPYLWVDPWTGRVFNADLTLPCSVIGHTDDEGDTWGSGANCAHADHQNLFAGPPPKGATTPAGYPNVVYYCALDAGAGHDSVTTGCSRSLDGGTTFERTGSPAFVAAGTEENGQFGVPGGCGGVTGHGRVGPDGTLFLPRGLCHNPFLAISRDEGDTWERVQVNGDLKMAVGIDDAIVTGSQPSGGVIDHEGRVAIDPAGNVFYIWVAEDHLPYLAVSRDGGKSFGRPHMVGYPGTVEAWGIAIEAGETGRIAISYMGTSNSPGGPYCTTTTLTSCTTADGKPPRPVSDYEKTTWSGYIGVSVDALAATPTFVTAAINDPAKPLVKGACKPVACQSQGDFHGMAVSPDGTPWAAFVDIDGIGIAGRLLDGPPLFGTLADQRPAVSAPPSTAPAACERRRVTIRIRAPRRAKIRSATVTAGGRGVRVRRRAGRYTAVLNLVGTRTVRVRITVRTTAGRTFRSTRHYRACR
jgi:hypothetical protein